VPLFFGASGPGSGGNGVSSAQSSSFSPPAVNGGFGAPMAALPPPSGWTAFDGDAPGALPDVFR